MRGILIFVVMVCVWPVTGQEFLLRPAPSFPESDARSVTQLFQSRDQVLWVGTNHAVYHFDGVRYQKQYRPDRKHHPSTAIAENANAEMWFGYDDGYLHSITLQGLNREITADSLKGASITSISFMDTADAIVTTYGRGAWQYRKGVWSKLKGSTLNGINDIYDGLVDQYQKVWLATDNGIWIVDMLSDAAPVHLDRSHELPDEIITQLDLLDGGEVCAGLYNASMIRISPHNGTWKVDPISAAAWTEQGVIATAPGGIIWRADGSNIFHIDANGKQAKVKLPDVIKGRISAMLVDQTGNLWIGAAGRLYMADPDIVLTKPGLKGIQAIATIDETVWVGSESGLFSIQPDGSHKKLLLTNEKINVISLYADTGGRLWIGTFGQGLYCFDPRSGRHIHLTEKDGLANGSILNIDGYDQTVFLATLGGITSLMWRNDPFKEKMEITDFQEQYGFPQGYVYDVHVAGDRSVWFGTDGKGLIRWAKREFLFFPLPQVSFADEVFQIKTVFSVTTDPEGRIWAGGENGIVLCVSREGELIRTFRLQESPITSLISTGGGDVLMVHEEGIEIIHEQGLRRTIGQGAGQSSFSPNINAVWKARDGNVWLADAETIVHYKPSSPSIHQQIRLHVDHIVPNTLWNGDTIRLHPDSNFLDIAFAGLWYEDPSNMRYRYKLMGHDEDWIESREGRAVYSRLSPGTYTFIVEGSTQDDFSMAGTMTRTFTVVPPYYKRWWFVASILLLVITLAILYILSRLRRIRANHAYEREKTMLKLHAIQAQVNPHFLFNSFNTLSYIIETDPISAVAYLDHLSGFFREVLIHRDAELILLSEELEIVRHYLFVLNRRYGTNLIVEEKTTEISGLIVPLSIQLLVENAIKHNVVSAEKPLRITITTTDKHVIVTNPIQPKFNTPHDSTGFGLSSLVARYQYLTGEDVSIQRDNINFTVSIPLIHKV